MPCARLQSPGRTDPFRVIGYPSTPDRSYMLNEQFTWLTPFSQQASPVLSIGWKRDGRHHRGDEAGDSQPTVHVRLHLMARSAWS